ncbi:MAG: 2-succinyl-5-enolpyruvyl-6-hydroxy-3-cyclohexene-1-carboxylic-acid synthase [Deltaproteobacteria bacterium]|nr:2-succinyl-5-enolpyruvyl-6-hydroxy-3-cyclohexene-1-carboxylic-acid synthase [Deltaproteobacteria bacterium]MBW2361571.1 2-succinyl-5-enolpyruvyl-6-hydroxy-3-cyclohexene-1-carboxylic-acid synthase [Deltaproteobacteria bacterium]
MPGDAPNRNHAFTRAFFAELVRSGVAHACICPGSRSTPLTAAAHREPGLRCWSHIDERSAGFFALGLAKASRAPVALVCTSGTAAVNFHPAVVEAHHAGVPLLVLTADRPPELRDWGAGQTIDQHALYGSAVRWFAEAPVPEPGDAALRQARALACRAAAVSAGVAPGPVHLNLPFREPLAPAPVAGDLGDAGALARAGRGDRAYTRVAETTRAPSNEVARALAEQLRGIERGVVVCGPSDVREDEARAIAELAHTLGWPLFAEATSQLRCGAAAACAPLVSQFDALLRAEAFAENLRADCVLRFGATPTSKAFRLWLEGTRPQHVLHVDPAGVWHDASHLASEVLPFAPGALCDALRVHLGAPRSSRWLEAALAAEHRALGVVEAELTSDATLHGPGVVRELGAQLPAGATLYVSNSLAVRDLDAFLPPGTPPLRVLCNRGANGIDGMLSSALGAAAADATRPTVLLTGDLAFLHDAGALLAARRNELSATIVVLDDDGGAIFSMLPVAAHAEAVGYEKHFRTRHGADICAIAGAYAARAIDITSWEHFRTELKQALAEAGVSVLRVPIDPAHALARRREIASAIAGAVAAEAAPR